MSPHKIVEEAKRVQGSAQRAAPRRPGQKAVRALMWEDMGVEKKRGRNAPRARRARENPRARPAEMGVANLSKTLNHAWLDAIAAVKWSEAAGSRRMRRSTARKAAVVHPHRLSGQDKRKLARENILVDGRRRLAAHEAPLRPPVFPAGFRPQGQSRGRVVAVDAQRIGQVENRDTLEAKLGSLKEGDIVTARVRRFTPGESAHYETFEVPYQKWMRVLVS